MKPHEPFGMAPESFKNSVSLALHKVEEGMSVKKPKIRLTIVIAFSLLLLASVVYAALKDWKLFDFYSERMGVTITEDAQRAIKQNDVQQRFEVGDLVITLQEAVADQHYLYVTAKAEAKKPDAAILLGLVDSPTDTMHIGGGADTQTRKSYRTAAMEEGKRLLSAEISLEVLGHEMGEGMGDTVLQPDGSLHVLYAMELPTAEEALEIDLSAHVFEWSIDGENDIIDQQKKTVRFTLPVTEPKEQVSLDLGGVLFPGTAAQMDQVKLTVSPLSCYYEITFTVVDMDDKLLVAHSRNVLRFEFLNESGEPLPVGMSMGGGMVSKDDVHYTQTGTVQLDTLPKTLTIRPAEDWGAVPNDVLILTIPDEKATEEN